MKLVQHIGLIHAHEANFTMTCGLNDLSVNIYLARILDDISIGNIEKVFFFCPDNGRKGDDNEVAYEESNEPRKKCSI